MNEKQYEAFRFECARREGYDIDTNDAPHRASGIKPSDFWPTYADHNEIQRIIDGLNLKEQAVFCTTLVGLLRCKKLAFGLTEMMQLVSASVEQKQSALFAVFGLEGK